MSVKTMVKMPIRIPPAGGVEYTPFGPRVDDPPTKMTDAMEMRVTKRSIGREPAEVSGYFDRKLGRQTEAER